MRCTTPSKTGIESELRADARPGDGCDMRRRGPGALASRRNRNGGTRRLHSHGGECRIDARTHETRSREGTRKAAHLDSTGLTINMSVNIWRLDLLDDELPAFLERLLTEHHYPAQRLTLEITETTLSSDPDQTARSIQRLRSLGRTGSRSTTTGSDIHRCHSSSRWRSTSLKVDKSFLIQLSSDTRPAPGDRTFGDGAGARSGTPALTEGIEEGAVLDLGVDFGGDIGQGFFIATPMIRLSSWTPFSRARDSARTC